jgi:hypothetical protein
MTPLLDVLQSVPILSFLPVVLLGLSAFLPQSIAAEIASVVLIFTSQVWKLTSARLRRTCEAFVRLISQVALRWSCVSMPGSTEFWDTPGVIDFAHLTHSVNMQI